MPKTRGETELPRTSTRSPTASLSGVTRRSIRSSGTPETEQPFARNNHHHRHHHQSSSSSSSSSRRCVSIPTTVFLPTHAHATRATKNFSVLCKRPPFGTTTFFEEYRLRSRLKCGEKKRNKFLSFFCVENLGF